MNKQSNIALLGPFSQSEFQKPYLDILQAAAAQDQALLHLASNPINIPQQIQYAVLFQAWPHQFSLDFFQALEQHCPLAPVLLLLGAACQGIERTSPPYSKSIRIYTCQWNSFHKQQFQRLLQNAPSLFALPPSFGDDEIFLAQYKDRLQPNFCSSKSEGPMPTCSLVSYDGPLGNDPAMNRMLAQYHAREGFNINYLAQDLHDCPAPDLILADADDSSFPRILKAVQRLRHRFADTDLNVYIHSPRINEVADLEQIGVRRVLPKPFFY